jgi:hypothetical protein
MKIPLLACALLSMPAHAGTISGSGAFTIDSLDRPEIVGDGFFVLDANRLVDFEFNFFGHTWTEADVPRCPLCVWEFQSPAPRLLFEWRDGDEFWILDWVFTHENFGFRFNLDGVQFIGTSENGEIGCSVCPSADDLTAPEPGSLALLLVGLLALPLSRRPA